ncbi:hypothetical protein SEMRO_2492_G329190.1 [Seminavis robusta]|uniref:Uncharacterized protein n=1 Tax=Seminavis robusta TaxID=568900 RepID=A0A9N8F1A0_9STRA|nr:hypothetical protein SEMRO_2492_G329190.1 [Seminavis robusta]|eukprot:Sro2492_g329190.1 n/a (118) ;mRNA; r:5081-5515
MDIREDIGDGRGLSLVSSEEEILQDRKVAIFTEFQAQKETADDSARMWEKAMYAKYTEGQAGEIMDRVLDYMRKSEFPTEPFHNWTEDLMEEAKTGWHKFKVYRDMLDKSKYGTEIR